MRNDQEEALKKILASNLARVFDLQKFAEAKNAVLLTLCSAWLIGIFNMLAAKKIPSWLETPVLLSMPGFFLAALMAVISFAPRKLWFLCEDKKEVGKRNLLFFADIESVDKETFTKEVVKRYRREENKNITERYIVDICEQTHINAGITNTKFKFFFIGVIFLFCGGAVLLFSTLIIALRTAG